MVRNLKPNTVAGNTGKHRESSEVKSDTGLSRIAARARKEPRGKFSNLLHHFTPELIAGKLSKMSSGSAVGIDGMTVSQARENLSWLLPPIMEQIHKRKYKAPPVRRVYIPKSDGRKRPLGIPTVIDRGLQAGLSEILNQIYEADFLGCSFGFRPGLSPHHALATINEVNRQWGVNFALEVDIRDFFGRLSHKWLKEFIEHRISDKRVLQLIEAWLKAGVMEDGKWQAEEAGTPQGGSISPLLANIYLHYVLDLWWEKKIKRQLKGKAHLIRYCDDFVFLFRERKDAEYVQDLLKARLAQFGLEIAEEKTHLTDLRPEETKNRNERGSRDRRRMTFLGFSVYKSKKRQGKGWKIVYKTESKRYTRARKKMKEELNRLMHWEIKHQARRINSILRGHFDYYGFAGNSRYIGNFYYEVIRCWRRVLSRRSQRGHVNWEKMNRVLAGNSLVRPKVRVPYTLMKAYAVL